MAVNARSLRADWERIDNMLTLDIEMGKSEVRNREVATCHIICYLRKHDKTDTYIPRFKAEFDRELVGDDLPSAAAAEDKIFARIQRVVDEEFKIEQAKLLELAKKRKREIENTFLGATEKIIDGHDISKIEQPAIKA